MVKVGHGEHVNNVERGRFGRNRSNVWHYAGVNTCHLLSVTLRPEKLNQNKVSPVTSWVTGVGNTSWRVFCRTCKRPP